MSDDNATVETTEATAEVVTESKRGRKASSAPSELKFKSALVAARKSRGATPLPEWVKVSEPNQNESNPWLRFPTFETAPFARILENGDVQTVILRASGMRQEVETEVIRTYHVAASGSLALAK